jgi:AraC-like DNA-binding protein
MKITAISQCYVSPAISVEQFIPEHFFLFLVKGSMMVYDGSKEYVIHAGDYGIGRRNHLAKYSKRPENGEFEKVVMMFDQDFLMRFKESHAVSSDFPKPHGGIIPLKKSNMVDNFITSLSPYFNDSGKIAPEFLDIKRSELLLILLKENPELAAVFFDFSIPAKIDLEEFMNRNYKFNISMERFAYLTGRSLSSFKRDFEKIFNATPAHWLVQKRLEEAYFLIDKKGKKASDIYIDLGFEDLSHFSFAFKKLFGVNASEI